MVETVLVHPMPGVTIYLPGGTHGFRAGPVPMRSDHAEALAAHVTMTGPLARPPEENQ